MNLKSNQIRLIAFDLDGTLLNAAKILTPRNKLALERAAEKGILIVPTTGSCEESGVAEVIEQILQ
jgi:hydroxymethylpyrimidine pyrophosphatase-like HAD family hydrolase